MSENPSPLPRTATLRRLQSTRLDGLSGHPPVAAGSGLLSASLCLSDSSGSTPLLDPRFSPSSPPAVRSNRQGRGVWVDTLSAGSVFRLLVSNVSMETTPHPQPDMHRTHAHISHFLERDLQWMERQALLL